MALRKQKTTNRSSKKPRGRKEPIKPAKPTYGGKNFHIEFKNELQSAAWSTFQQNDVLFLVGPAGCGKTFLASAFAIEQVLNRQRSRIILTRPIVEAGESLGYLPGEFEEKVHPYMMPLYDCMDTLVGREGPQRDRIDEAVEVAPLAYMRGRTFHDAICIFDEAQNASMMQLKLFLTRFGDNSKLVITGDPTQSDIAGKVALVEVIQKLRGTEGIGVIEFKNNSIVRHKLVGKMLEKLEA